MAPPDRMGNSPTSGSTGCRRRSGHRLARPVLRSERVLHRTGAFAPTGTDVSNLLLLVACLAIGMLLQHSARTPANAHQALNAVILNVSLPAVTLRALHGFAFDPNQLWPVL